MSLLEVKLREKRVYKGKGKSRRYSDAFKRKVVSDIQNGLYSANQALAIYKIGGTMTVYNWLAKYDHGNVFAHRGGRMKNTKKDTVVDMKSRIRYLEQIVSDLNIEKKILETTIDIVSEEYGIDLKKNIGNALLSKSVKKVSQGSHSKK